MKKFSIHKSSGNFGLGRQLRNPTLNKRSHIIFDIRKLSKTQSLGGGTGVILPPILDKLLAWVKGNILSGDTREDSYTKPGDFPMELRKGACLLSSGATDYGTTLTNHGTIVSSGGTSTLGYDGTTLTMTAGTVFNILFSDGTLYPCSETSPTATHCFSTDYENDGHSIALTSNNLSALRSGRQEEYFRNAVSGYGKRENLIKWSEDFSYWGFYDGASYEDGHEAPDGTLTASKIVSSANGGYFFTSVVSDSSINLSHIVWLKGVGDVAFKSADGNGIYITLTQGWVKYITPSSINSYERFQIQNIGIGDEVYVWHPQRSQSETPYVKTENYIFDGTELLPFLNEYPGNQWNGAENLQRFKQVQAGSFLATDSIATPTNLGSIVTSKGSGVPSYDGATLTSTDGTVYDVEFDSGVVVPIGEGTGSIIHDSLGNVVGTLTTNSELDFWTKVTPQKLIDMDAGIGFFVDQLTDETLEFHETDMDVAPFNVNKQYYFGNCARSEVLTYDQTLTDAEDIKVKLSQCWEIQYLVDAAGAYLVDSVGSRLMNLHKK